MSVNGPCLVGAEAHDDPEKAITILGHARALFHEGVPHRVAKRPAASRVPAQHTAHSTPSLSDRFPIVGTGASAGGFEALEAFFTSIPADSGMAFVVLTHPSPQHFSLRPDLLRVFTSPLATSSTRTPMNSATAGGILPDGVNGSRTWCRTPVRLRTSRSSTTSAIAGRKSCASNACRLQRPSEMPAFMLLVIEGATAHRAKADNLSCVRAYLPDGT